MWCPSISCLTFIEVNYLEEEFLAGLLQNGKCKSICKNDSNEEHKKNSILITKFPLYDFKIGHFKSLFFMRTGDCAQKWPKVG